MKIKKLAFMIGTFAFLVYLIGGALVSLFVIRSSIVEFSTEINTTISTLVADNVIEPLKLGSFVEARTRIQTFIKQGLFTCAELSYDGMPISKCQTTENLKPFSTELKLSTQETVKNPILITYVDEKKLQTIAIKKGLSFVIFIFAFGLIFVVGIVILLSKIGTEITLVTNEVIESNISSKNNSVIYEINFLRKKMKEYLLLKETELKAQALFKISKQVAHDIRSPLSSLEFAIKDIEIDEERKAILSSVSSRIKGIADDLLERSRLQFQNSLQTKSNHINSVDLNSIIQQIVVEKRLSTNSIEFKMPPEKLLVIADSVELGRVISNLLNNSLEAQAEGRELSVEIQTREFKDKIILIIKDNGEGIPTHLIPFVTRQGFTSGKKNGNGLGLSYANTKLNQWGGKLKVFSSEGEGTIVSLQFQKASNFQSKL